MDMQDIFQNIKIDFHTDLDPKTNPDPGSQKNTNVSGRRNLMMCAVKLSFTF